MNDWEVARYTSHIPYPYTVQMADEFIAAQAEAPASGSQASMPILLRRASALVGCVGLHRDMRLAAWRDRLLDRPQILGPGLCQRGRARVVDFAFNDLGMAELEAGAVPVNKASHRVLAKAGFIACDVREEDAPARGHPLQLIMRAAEARALATCRRAGLAGRS